MDEIYAATPCVNVGNDNHIFSNVVLEFIFHSIINYMCYCLKKDEMQMVLLGFILILNLHVIVFAFVAKIISKLPVCTWICQWYVPFSVKKSFVFL